MTTTLLETANAIPSLAQLGQETFSDWEAIFAAKLVHDGLSEKRASALASLALSSLQGALVLARVGQKANSIENVAMEIGALFKLAVTEAKTD